MNYTLFDFTIWLTTTLKKEESPVSLPVGIPSKKDGRLCRIVVIAFLCRIRSAISSKFPWPWKTAPEKTSLTGLRNHLSHSDGYSDGVLKKRAAVPYGLKAYSPDFSESNN